MQSLVNLLLPICDTLQCREWASRERFIGETKSERGGRRRVQLWVGGVVSSSREEVVRKGPDKETVGVE